MLLLESSALLNPGSWGSKRREYTSTLNLLLLTFGGNLDPALHHVDCAAKYSSRALYMEHDHFEATSGARISCFEHYPIADCGLDYFGLLVYTNERERERKRERPDPRGQGSRGVTIGSEY